MFPFLRAIVPFWIALAAAPLALAADEAAVFHDGQLTGTLLRAGERFKAAGTATPADELRRQLQRGQCEVSLPAAGRAPLAGGDLLRARRPGVLIVGGLYKCDRCTRWHTSTATGFALTGSGIFVTCHHVLAAEDREAFCVMNDRGEVFPVVEVLAADQARDVVICRAEGRGFAPLPLAAANADAGAAVSLISHPASRFFMLTEGRVSRYFKLGRTGGAQTFMAITADFAKGSSGGPVFDARGNVVGMAASTHSIYYDTKDGRKDNLQMVIKQCVPVEAIRGLIRAP